MLAMPVVGFNWYVTTLAPRSVWKWCTVYSTVPLNGQFSTSSFTCSHSRILPYLNIFKRQDSCLLCPNLVRIAGKEVFTSLPLGSIFSSPCIACVGALEVRQPWRQASFGPVGFDVCGCHLKRVRKNANEHLSCLVPETLTVSESLGVCNRVDFTVSFPLASLAYRETWSLEVWWKLICYCYGYFQTKWGLFFSLCWRLESYILEYLLNKSSPLSFIKRMAFVFLFLSLVSV